MLKTDILRALGTVTLLAVLGTACGSSTTTDASSTETTIASGGPIVPDDVARLGLSLTGSAMGSTEVDCIIERAEGDSQLTGVLAGAGTAGYRFTPEAFTALGVAVHACVSNEVLSASLLAFGGAEDEASQNDFSACMSEQIADEVDGDLTYVGLSALSVGLPVPPGASESTIDASRGCVPPMGVANQFAAGAEQAASFAIEVDRDCLLDSVDDEFLDSFWSGVVDGEQLPDLDGPIDDCSAPYDSGLPKELPADFVPWTGDGALAGIDPASREGAFEAAPPMIIDQSREYEAVLTTGDGEIRVRLYADQAPITVNNFVSLARDGFYDGTTFHRVIDGFMAQAGDPTGTGSGGPGYRFDDEESGLTPVDRRGLLAMANSGADTNGSQFFITFAAADHLNGLHTVFGEVIEGDDVLADVDIRDPSAPTSRGEPLITVEIIER